MNVCAVRTLFADTCFSVLQWAVFSKVLEWGLNDLGCLLYACRGAGFRPAATQAV
jgi:hypothetical protein